MPSRQEMRPWYWPGEWFYQTPQDSENSARLPQWKKKLNKSVHPNEAVDYGAVVQADILSGDKSENGQDLLLLVVTPLSQSIETGSRVMTVLTKHNDCPNQTQYNHLHKTDTNFTTYSDNQQAVHSDVWRWKGLHDQGQQPAWIVWAHRHTYNTLRGSSDWSYFWHWC